MGVRRHCRQGCDTGKKGAHTVLSCRQHAHSQTCSHRRTSGSPKTCRVQRWTPNLATDRPHSTPPPDQEVHAVCSVNFSPAACVHEELDDAPCLWRGMHTPGVTRDQLQVCQAPLSQQRDNLPRVCRQRQAVGGSCMRGINSQQKRGSHATSCRSVRPLLASNATTCHQVEQGRRRGTEADACMVSGFYPLLTHAAV